MLGSYKANTWVAFFATTGVILSAAYALWLFARVVYGKLEKHELETIPDLDARELALLVPLALAGHLFWCAAERHSVHVARRASMRCWRR